MNLYLIRHAESEGNADKTAYERMPEWEIPLTEKGKEQAKEVGMALNHVVDPIIISSPYVRAKDTAEIIGKYSLTFPSYQECPLIREREWGVLRQECDEFETREERNHLFDFYRRPNGGESFADCYQRAFIFFRFLVDSYRNKKETNIFIVSHGEFLKLLLMIIDSVTVEEFENMPNIKNCEIIIRHV